MNNIKQLLAKMADDFNIKRGMNETEKNFNARIIYSVICRLSYASLWDKLEDSGVSIQHFKNKIDELLKIYLEIYPEVKISENLSEEIYDLYLKTGNFYHQPYNISASMLSIAKQENILFLRGITPNQKIYMSGAGFYLPSNYEKIFDTSNFKNLPEMFLLQDKSLQDFWNEIIKNVDWKESALFKDAEYLRMSPPFNKGYWQKNPIYDGKILLVRKGEFDPKDYYLYKFEGKKFLCSRLPDWQTCDEFFTSTDYDNYRGGVYRQIACACLENHKILPPIKFKIEGLTVQTKIEYLPPPAELYLWTLYSWAKNFSMFPNNFERIFDRDVFFALKKVFEEIGYKFVEE